MLDKSFGMLYYLKQAKNQKDENRYIYLRITVNGVRCELSIKRQWALDLWDSQLGRAVENSENAKVLNRYLDLVSGSVYQAKIKLLERNKPLTAANIKKVLTGDDEKEHFILEVFNHHHKQMKALVGRSIAPATLTRYKTACDHVKNFIIWQYQKDDLEVKELNYDFVSQFLFWLQTEKLCNNNTAVKYLGNFKKIILECKRKGFFTHDPFLGFKMKRNEVTPMVLTKHELINITNKKFDTERLNNVRDIFLFSCYTG